MKRGAFKLRIHPLSLLPLPIFLYFNPPAVLAAMLGAGALHELGHLCAALMQKRSIRAFEINPFGAQFRMEEKSHSYRADIVLHLSGPLANLCAALLCLLLIRAYPYAMHFFCFYLNALLFFFHLLPLDSLDGGAVLYAILCERCDPQSAFFFCRKVSFCVLCLLSTGLVILLWLTGFHLSLFFGMSFLLLSLGAHFLRGAKKHART